LLHETGCSKTKGEKGEASSTRCNGSPKPVGRGARLKRNLGWRGRGRLNKQQQRSFEQKTVDEEGGHADSYKKREWFGFWTTGRKGGTNKKSHCERKW